ncbi:MAG: DUF4258 domain-containing protein [Termitinemataceae bacterium]|nr:MAG: DUF4258 domain-containing protein [Termitinemataceae bacterium]
MDITNIQKLCSDKTIVLTNHLQTRMRQRGISYSDIKRTIQKGKIIEDYQTDYPFPSCLISAIDLHVVCSMGDGVLYIITAYRPSPEQWEADGKTRRRNEK